ncbi:MAG: formylglycine-generating enzyme family protein [Thermoguttaceae bacterium]|nr:formylglycine-generating enzyme family protein [Thermoguttaceae bacterium]
MNRVFIASVLALLLVPGTLILGQTHMPVQNSSLDTPGTKAGEKRIITVNGVEFAFRWCPPGKFIMGTPDTERWYDNDKEHQVTLTQGFWMMETEVTQKQWKAVMGTNPSHFKGDDLPVERVYWNDCQEFCKKTGFQLPTEAQWEYACRAGTTEAYAGNLDEMAWYGSYSTPKGTSTEEATHPVGTKKPNAWGLYDMYGNVQEWCADWHGDYPSESVTDPAEPSNGVNRVNRGGSWNSPAWYCRSAYRNYLVPESRHYSLGARFLRSITTQKN